MEIPSHSLRPMTADDLAKVVEIEKRCHVAPWNRTNFEGEFQKPYSVQLVLTDDDTDEVIFGYVVFWKISDSVEILNIVVDLEFRGMGLAKKMLRQVVQHAIKNDAKHLILDVRKSNAAALFLYQKTGFIISQIRKGFYSNGEDAYQMTLNLEQAKVDF